MNPIGTEDRIRKLKLILSDDPTHCAIIDSKPGHSQEPEFVIERYVITEDDKMRVERPGMCKS